MSPPPDRRPPTGPASRPPAPKGGAAPKGAPPPKGSGPRPSTDAPRPATGGVARPAPKGAAPPKAAPKAAPKAPAKRPAAPAPAPKAFEIRKGRADEEGGGAVDEEDRPLGGVVLPRSITQEAEEESLKERFGVDKLPEVAQRNTLVTVTDSAGQAGPERSARRTTTLVLVLVLAGAAVAVALKVLKVIP